MEVAITIETCAAASGLARRVQASEEMRHILTEAPKPRGNGRHVVMMVANRFTHDTRVWKEAHSLQGDGWHVEVLAMAGLNLPAEENQDGVPVSRLPLPGISPLPLLLTAPALVLHDDRRFTRWAIRHGGAQGPTHAPSGPDAGPPAPAPSERAPAKSSRAADEPCAPRAAPARGAHGSSAPREITHKTDRAGSEGHGTPARGAATSAAAGAPSPLHRAAKMVIPRRVRDAIRPFLLPRPTPRTRPKRAVVIRRESRAEHVLGRAARSRLFSLAGALRRALLRRLVSPQLQVLAMNFRFAAAAAERRPDVIVAHDLNTLLAGLLVKSLTGAALVYDSHELFLERNIGTRSRWRDRMIWAPIERAAIGRCDAVMSVAEGICIHLARQYGIPQPSLVRNVQPWEPAAPRSRLLSDELRIAHEKSVVVYAGAITINRGLEQMIDAAPLLDGSVFVIMGPTSNPAYRRKLEALAAERGVLGTSVYFRDAVPMQSVTQYLASSDLTIVPTQNCCLSYYYESSNKIFHSLMAGIPLVMSDHIEKRLIVERYGVGRLFDETDPKDIARVVNEALHDRQAWVEMHERCLDAGRELNWEREEARLRDLYAALPTPSRSRRPGGDDSH